jgi:hypothetical protein
MPKPVLPIGCWVRVTATDARLRPVCRADVGRIVEDLGRFRLEPGMVQTYRVQFPSRQALVFGCPWQQWLFHEDEIEPVD